MKTMKKIMSLLLVLTMAVSLSLTAFAAEPLTNGTLKVTGVQLQGKEVTTVRMFTANVDDKNSNGMIDETDLVSYEMESAWQGFFNEQLAKQSTENATSAEAYQHVADMKDHPTKLVDFAKAAKAYYNAHSTAFASLTQKQTAGPDDTATFADLTTGYYLVLPANGSTGANRATDAMIVNVPGAKATNLQLKTEYPTVQKVIVDNGSNVSGASAQIGDKLTFHLTSKVPNMDGYTTYVFNFKDTMSKGLTLDKNSVKVTIDGHEVATEHYKVSHATDSQGVDVTVLEVKFADLTKVPGATAGATIKVEYSATLNEKAQTGATNPNTNKAELEYSNDPVTGGTGTSKPSITNTYTFDIQVHKYAKNDKEKAILPGAVFELHDAEGHTIALVKEKDGYTYRVATPKEIADQTPTHTQFTTVAGHNIGIKGLKEGTYKLHEVTAPTGYNKLTKDVTIVITADYETDGTLKTGFPTYAVDGVTTTESSVIEVQNNNGAFLPETGSIGTIGLTLAGVALVIGGVGFTSRKKKEQE